MSDQERHSERAREESAFSARVENPCHEKSSRSLRMTILVSMFWILGIAVAACFDRAIAVWVHAHEVDAWMRSHALLADILKVPGLYYFTVAVAVLAAIAHPLKWRAGIFVVLATLVSGVNGFIKWVVGRTRPFKLEVFDEAGRAKAMPFSFSPFRGGMHGLFHQTNLCFPSGHAALAFATAAAVAMLRPRSVWRWLGFFVAAVVAAERVLENAHWLSDTVGAAALGIGGVHVIRWMIASLTRDARSEGSSLSMLNDE
jgi:membrane-associated phospholipid phosphatase